MPPSLTPAIRTLIEAANHGDTDAFLGAFTPHQGVVDDWGTKVPRTARYPALE